MILVSGASGNIGREVVRLLLARGQRVRTLTRDPARTAAVLAGTDIVAGNFDSPQSLRDAVSGISAVFLLSAPGPSLPMHDQMVLDAIGRSNVSKVVKLSAIGTSESPIESGPSDWHAPGEKAVRTSHVDWTIFRPSSFMSNALMWAQMIKARTPVPITTGDGRTADVDPRDIAAAAVEALLTDRHSGKIYTLTGAELLTAKDRFERLARLLGRPIETVDIPADGVRHALVTIGVSELYADRAARGHNLIRDGKAEVLTGDLKAVLGRDPLRFDDWGRDHIEVFR